jgi:hypothetical protein
MRNLFSFSGAALAALLFALPSVAEEYEFAPLPPGDGAEEVYYNCIACHSLTTVVNQRLSRRVWNEVLVWMVEDQGMQELEPEEFDTILDYLSTHLGIEEN